MFLPGSRVLWTTQFDSHTDRCCRPESLRAVRCHILPEGDCWFGWSGRELPVSVHPCHIQLSTVEQKALEFRSNFCTKYKHRVKNTLKRTHTSQMCAKVVWVCEEELENLTVPTLKLHILAGFVVRMFQIKRNLGNPAKLKSFTFLF